MYPERRTYVASRKAFRGNGMRVQEIIRAVTRWEEEDDCWYMEDAKMRSSRTPAMPEFFVVKLAAHMKYKIVSI